MIYYGMPDGLQFEISFRHQAMRPAGEEPHLTPIDNLDKRFDPGIKDAIV